MPYGGAVQVRLGVEREPVYGALKPTTFVVNFHGPSLESRHGAYVFWRRCQEHARRFGMLNDEKGGIREIVGPFKEH